MSDPRSPTSVDIWNAETSTLIIHALQFASQQQHFYLSRETVFVKNDPIFASRGVEGSLKTEVGVRPISLVPNASILSQRNDPENYPVFTYLSQQYSKIAIYRDWTFGRNSVIRHPQPADMRIDRLEEDFSNLGLVLNRLYGIPKVKRKIIEYLKDIYAEVDDIHINVYAGTVQIFFIEGDFRIPATRLSDGTLRYLCLLAILCDPEPPPLICLEEPELGLHPDLLPKVADLLIEASTRTQLIVTTHSDILVDAMTPTPEAILVCEKHEGKTEIKRLDPEALSVWLEKYRLGELWTRGEIGGTRW